MRARVLVVMLSGAMACGSDPADGDGSTGAVGSDTTPGTSVAGSSTGAPASTGSGADSSAGPADGSGAPGSDASAGDGGCGMAATPGDTVVQIDVDGTAREYTLVIPDGYDPDTPMPLVFAFHGLGGNSGLARLYFGIEDAAGDAAIFVYPQGLPVADQGGATGWDLAPDGIDVAMFDAILAEVDATLCIDRARVFATGHSFGGYISNALGCFRAADLRAIGPVAGGPPFAACQDERVAAWMAHGMSDMVVPFSQGEAARDSVLARNGCGETTMSVDPSPCVAYDGCADGFGVTWCAHAETDQMGHLWPSWAGAAIWGFFAGLGPKP